MKKYEELSVVQQSVAVRKCLVELLELVIEGAIRFSDDMNHSDLQARIDAACKAADRMMTPWFAHEYILETCRQELEEMARADAETALYPEDNDHVVFGILD